MRLGATLVVLLHPGCTLDRSGLRLPVSDSDTGTDSDSESGSGSGSDCGDLETCGEECVDTLSDDRHCGACGLACPGSTECCRGACVECGMGAACVDGACVCTAGLADCDPGPGLWCSRPATDVRNCGACGVTCGPTEYCEAGACTCRPGLTPCVGFCLDLESNDVHCGACGMDCGPDNCLDSVCTPDCGARTNCSGQCVDLATDTNNCGACRTACAVDQLCVAGVCRTFVDGLGCDSCPCETCAGTFSRCCPYPGAAQVVCVDGAAADCP